MFAIVIAPELTKLPSLSSLDQLMQPSTLDAMKSYLAAVLMT
jgi:hypothetical protein